MNSIPEDSSPRITAGNAPAAPAMMGASVVTGTAILALQLGRLMEWHGWQEPATLIASTGFVLVALLGGATRDAFGRFMLAALACCWAGDMLGPLNFMLGTYAFLIAHLLFIPAFFALRPAWRATCLAALPVGLVSLLSTALLWPRVPPGDRMAIAFYTVAISVMVALALGAGRHSRLVPIAAVLFYTSDHFVARWKYIGGDWNGLVCYPLYYTACLLFALSVYRIGRSHASR